MSAPEEERIGRWGVVDRHGFVYEATYPNDYSAVAVARKEDAEYREDAPHRVVRLVELREGDLFVRAEEMEGVKGWLAEAIEFGLETSLDWDQREFATMILNSLRRWRTAP